MGKKKSLLSKLVLRQICLTGGIFILLVGMLYLRKHFGYFDYPILTGLSEVTGIALAFVVGGIINGLIHHRNKKKKKK